MTRRSVALLAVLLTVGCASSTSPHGLSIGVTELRQQGHPLPVLGTHFYIIRVQNRGADTITVHTITIAPAGMTELDVDNATETFDETVNPQQESRFNMVVTVQYSRAAMGTISNTIQSLRVTIGGQGANGTFFDTGEYPIGVEAPQD